MKLVGLMLARNEEWVLGASIDAALRWIDHLVFVNHGSTDASRVIAAGFANSCGRVTVHDWQDGEHWAEMDARQKSLDLARELGATHIAIVDADELLTHNNIDFVRGWFEKLGPGQCLDLPMIASWKSLDWHSWQTGGVITLGFADRPDLCWKPRGTEKYHYHARAPQGEAGRVGPIGPESGGVFHLQYAAWERLLWKHRHYMMSERVRWNYPAKEVNEKYHWWDRPPHGMDLKAVPASWWGDYRKGAIDLGAIPWHKGECERLWAQYHAMMFEGLDFWGWKP